MRVRIECQAHLRVAERLHYDARMDPLTGQQGRGRVPQVVKSQVWQFGSLRPFPAAFTNARACFSFSVVG